MPLFFIVSGFLHRPVKKEGLVEACAKKLVSYGKPYLVFSLYNYLLLKAFSLLIIGAFGIICYGWGRNPLWFLPMILVINLLWNICESGPKILRYIIIAMLVSLLVIRVLSNNAWLPYSMNEIPFYFACFLLGVVFKPYWGAMLSYGWFPYLTLLIPVWMALVYHVFLFFPDYRLSGDIASFFLRLGLGVVGTLFVFSLSKALERSFAPIRSLLSWIGKNTLVILCVHWPYYLIVSSFGFHPIVTHILAISLTVLTIIVYNKIPYLR